MSFSERRPITRKIQGKVMSPEELRLPMPWGHIAARAWGSPKDERVLVVHGILDNAGSFDRLIALLPRGYYFVCIDLPGHGLSSHFPAGLSLDYFNYVLSIRRVLDFLKWETCAYLAHSLGANLGMIFSAIYPERITKILCIDGMNSRPIPNEDLIASIKKVHDHTLRIKEQDKISGRLYTEEEVIYKLMYQRGNVLNVAAAQAVMPRSVTLVGDKYKFNRDLRINVGLLPFFNYEQHRTLLKQIDIPVVIVLASSTMARRHYQGVKELIYEMMSFKKFHFVIVEGNHDVHNNHPERIAPHVSRFLGSVKSSL